MILDIMLTDYLLKRKYSSGKVILLMSIYNVILYTLLTLVFYDIFLSFAKIIPAIILFIVIGVLRILYLKRHTKKWEAEHAVFQ
jgi:E3 ubiquitin-protein ligase DOA10